MHYTWFRAFSMIYILYVVSFLIWDLHVGEWKWAIVQAIFIPIAIWFIHCAWFR